MEVSAELEFIDQQNLILNMENQTLKQRLDSLAQEHLIKKRMHISVSILHAFALASFLCSPFRHYTLIVYR